MKKFIFCIIFCIFIIPIIGLADSCTYSDTEQYTEMVEYLVYNGTETIVGDPLSLHDFSNSDNKSIFFITNPNDFEVLAVLSYVVEGHCNKQMSYGKRIVAGDTVQITDICFDDEQKWETYINESAVSYYVSDSGSTIVVAEVETTKTRTICDKACTGDSECGSTCNIAGYCGTISDVCPEGTTNCDNLACFVPGSKTEGETYFCEWQCASGLGIDGVCKSDEGEACTADNQCYSNYCNYAGFCGEFIACPEGTTSCNDNLCLEPSTKEIGEDYVCEFQCESGNGVDGVCTQSVYIQLLKPLSISALLALLVYIGKFFFDKKRRDRLAAEMKKEEEAIKELNETKDFLIRAVEELTKEQISSLQVLEKVKGSINNAKSKASQILQEEINKLRNKSNTFSELVEDIGNKNKEIEKRTQEHIQKTLEAAKKTYNINFLYDNGYLRFKNGKNEFHHRYVARKEIFYTYPDFFRTHYPGKSYKELQVHHIDCVKTNNDPKNLAIITWSQHQKINHSKIPTGNRQKGLSELRRNEIKVPHFNL